MSERRPWLSRSILCWFLGHERSRYLWAEYELVVSDSDWEESNRRRAAWGLQVDECKPRTQLAPCKRCGAILARQVSAEHEEAE